MNPESSSPADTTISTAAAESTGSIEVTNDLLYQFNRCLDMEKKQATFACGGIIPIKSHEEVQEENERARGPRAFLSPPVALRWDSPAETTLSKHAKLIFPLEPETEENFQGLVKTMEPATFGRGGEDVFDESYRKASKMDPTAFSTTFNPYSLGIIDTIAQALLPSKLDSGHRGVMAELYKLNIYSGPSGKFKPHVDTSRSKLHFGSLVVCLPVSHEGGHLQIRHHGKELTFDWGTSTTDADHASIRWAAFYSDCEHEVREVLSGHRVTLTYNLYAVRGAGLQTGHCPALEPSHFPLYQFVESMLREEMFMDGGGYLGFGCAHAYPHTAVHHSQFPDTLKGLDMVTWETFSALGLKASVHPIVFDDDSDDEDNPYDDEDSKPPAYLGDSFQIRLETYHTVGEGSTFQDMMEEFEGGISYNDVSWVTQPRRGGQPQVFYMAYGNQASPEIAYSECVIVVKVPSFVERKGKLGIAK